MDPFEISVQRFNEFANEYTERFMNIEAYKPSVDNFCSLMKSAQPAILELACGPGNYTLYLKARFPESRIIAVDLAPGMIEIARKLVKDVDFRVGDVRNISSFDLQFDGIMCSFCLPFLSAADTSKLIADCTVKLDKGGAIYISTMEGDSSKAGFEPTSFSGKSEIYFNYHKHKDIESALVENGLRIHDFKRQDYYEPGGEILTDMIFIAVKP